MVVVPIARPSPRRQKDLLIISSYFEEKIRKLIQNDQFFWFSLDKYADVTFKLLQNLLEIPINDTAECIHNAASLQNELTDSFRDRQLRGFCE